MKKALRLIALSMVLIVAIMALASCAKPNSDPEKAKEALEDAGYSVDLTNDSVKLLAANAIYGGDVEAVVSAFKLDLEEEENNEAIVIIYYEDAEAADDAFETVEKYADEEADEDVDYEIKKSGNMIWFGTKDAVKDAA
ncbi:MAG: hypothetical protein E7643_04495 [Ruminococcaceae bacterium]|nr:hypothetical protein [Oscillospiraceae bacterium]